MRRDEDRDEERLIPPSFGLFLDPLDWMDEMNGWMRWDEMG